MRFAFSDGEELSRIVGAAVVRASHDGDFTLDLGPADGARLLRITMSHDEAVQLASAIRRVVDTGNESVLLVDN